MVVSHKVEIKERALVYKEMVEEDVDDELPDSSPLSPSLDERTVKRTYLELVVNGILLDVVLPILVGLVEVRRNGEESWKRGRTWRGQLELDSVLPSSRSLLQKTTSRTQNFPLTLNSRR